MSLYNKKTISKAFSVAASHYDTYATVQKKSAEYLFSLINPFISPHSVLDLGSGTGFLSKKVESKYPCTTIYAVDIAFGMLTQAQSYHDRLMSVCADADSLPFPDSKFDLILSNLMLQWSPNINATIQEMLRVLAPGGYCLFSTIGPNSLPELHHAWQRIDEGIHVHSFSLWEQINMPSRIIKITYTEHFHNIFDLMNSLKQIGAANLHYARKRGLLTPRKLKLFADAYEGYRTKENFLPLSYEIYFGVIKK